jgi:hypothetical protein
MYNVQRENDKFISFFKKSRNYEKIRKNKAIICKYKKELFKNHGNKKIIIEINHVGLLY